MRSADRWHCLVAGLDLHFGDGAVALGMQRRSISSLRSKAADCRPSPRGRQRPRAPRGLGAPTREHSPGWQRAFGRCQAFKLFASLAALRNATRAISGPLSPPSMQAMGAWMRRPVSPMGPIITHLVRPAFTRSTLPSPRKSTCRYTRSGRRLAVMEQNSKCTVPIVLSRPIARELLHRCELHALRGRLRSESRISLVHLASNLHLFFGKRPLCDEYTWYTPALSGQLTAVQNDY